MASPQEWIFSPRVEWGNDREKLDEDLRTLLGLGWIPTDPPNGIRKVFTFATVDDAVDFHSIVSSSTIKNRHDALLELEGATVSALWTTHKPGPRGLSRLDYSMARICDIIAGVLKNDQRVWEGLRTEYQVYTPLTKIFYFRYHSYVIDFVRALGVVAKPELLLGSIQLRSTPKSVELILPDKNIRPELAIWLEFVKESVIKSEGLAQDVTIEGGQRRVQFNSVGEALNFHTLVHRCFVSKWLSIESLCEGKSVTVKSPDVGYMYKCINLIADAVSGNFYILRTIQSSR
ncbi:pterin-4-alpha-carbinolamine dehydratase [Aspergillus terreus]|uniref:4a-hydroxytetrahydrobiopterin dehydratase n=1 Tax=Aspergillus terreus TaxID=33178 RepID=A0A5M3YPA1_ASPTE|nr:hypothetical protein ATETN484_0002048500 [Aspergillus terreus]GFF15341.1 pterin-4-alpha-carbinolamine dehydratase [Aspergillus terreus]